MLNFGESSASPSPSIDLNSESDLLTASYPSPFPPILLLISFPFPTSSPTHILALSPPILSSLIPPTLISILLRRTYSRYLFALNVSFDCPYCDPAPHDLRRASAMYTSFPSPPPVPPRFPLDPIPLPPAAARRCIRCRCTTKHAAKSAAHSTTKPTSPINTSMPTLNLCLLELAAALPLDLLPPLPAGCAVTC
ncbi:hypothetical protein EIP86_006760 [Pleurotus ostreatoroseus]|nr:hypothetical protein EIP86_006760 [Pleurotus ostreatoroseus]